MFYLRWFGHAQRRVKVGRPGRRFLDEEDTKLAGRRTEDQKTRLNRCNTYITIEVKKEYITGSKIQ